MAMNISHSRACLGRFQCNRIPLRHASTSTAKVKIPPESPRFIDIPQPPQQQAYRKPYVKGVLPLPRELFGRKDPNRTTPEYLAAVTPEPAVKKHHAAPQVKALADWKSRQAAIRRQNLRESLVELHQRKVRADRRRAAISTAKQAEHERKIHEPEREDERLTNSSILNALIPGSHQHLPDPGREERIAQMKARFEAKEAAKQAERRNALHSLYMNARSFIVTEEELNKKVDEVFDDPWYQLNPEHSVWDKEGFPNSMQSMLLDTVKARSEAVNELTKRRAKRLAEELTGGKMD